MAKLMKVRPSSNARNIVAYKSDNMSFPTAGGWLYDKQHGHARYTWDNGDYHVGHWIGGQRHGNGKMEWKNGNIYTGSWKNGMRTGQGRIEWRDGGEFDGDIYEGMKEVEKQLN